jgi:plastocyanin
MTFRLIVAAAALGLLALAGCRPPPAEAAATPPPTMPPGNVRVVTIENMTFSPASVRVGPGDQVRFENHDLVPHTATAKGDVAFDSGPILPGKSWTLNPPAGKTVQYACLFHPTMKGEIISQP